ncbi:hypothetical protein WH5701_16071 [Synechococcus sp. WH 5701]|jgi:hypothetical protein|nr:hypothetical protein WH5701_16071 [Synechococcus sp. WH 5701]CAK6693063.1 hypothetical protein ICNINCKA_01337 [Synechococcus sp. CBW1107]CAK6701474.1 hypothetical protein BBFGKLBO_03128 [Synechococcus sp. CBW1107]
MSSLGLSVGPLVRLLASLGLLSTALLALVLRLLG